MAIKGELPKNYGNVEQQELEKDTLPTDSLRFTPAAASSEFAYFNHAAVFEYCSLPLDKDPVADWWTREGDSSIRVLYRPFPYKLIEGLNLPFPDDPTRTYGHYVFAIEKSKFRSLYAFLEGVILNQIEHGYVARMKPYTYTLESRMVTSVRGPTTFDVTVFGLAGSSASIAVRPRRSKTKHATSLYLSPAKPDPEMQGLAKHIAVGDLSAAAAIEGSQMEDFVLTYNQWLALLGGKPLTQISGVRKLGD